MKVILQEKIANLGNVGDQVNVKAGYARNFLVPKNKAVAATEDNIADFETRRAELEKAARDQLDAAKKRGEQLDALAIAIEAQASDEGKLFGSIGPRDVADAVTAAGVEISKSEVNLPEGPIRSTGEFVIAVQVHSEVTANVKLNVKAIEKA